MEWSVFLSENIKYEIMTGLRESWSGVKDQIYKDLSYKRITLDECLWRDVKLECQLEACSSNAGKT